MLLHHLRYFLLVGFLFSAGAANAQWSNVSAGQIPSMTSPGSGCVLTFCDGVLWSAFNNTLYMSADSGTTWVNRSIPGTLGLTTFDVDFFDTQTGVASLGGFAYLTTNAGVNWTQIIGPGQIVFSIRFLNSTNDLVACVNQNAIMISRDAGQSWSNITPAYTGWYIHTAVRRATNELYVLIDRTGGNASRVLYSDDYGSSWQIPNAGMNYDCWMLAIDSCDPNLIYTINEEIYASEDGRCGIYVSTNRGSAWTQPYSVNSQDHLNGSISVSSGGVAFAQTLNTGVLRSINGGQTWVSIQGPNGPMDSRTVCAIAPNIIFATDDQGGVWKTTNGGGDPVSVQPGQGVLYYSPRQLYNGLPVQLCDSLQTTLQIIRGNCQTPDVVGVAFADATMNDYRIIEWGNDSVVVQFDPKRVGFRNNELVLTLSDGTTSRITMTGVGIDSGYKVYAEPSSLHFGDSIPLCGEYTKSLKIWTSGCALVPVSIDSTYFIGAGSLDYTARTIGDSVVIAFRPSQLGTREAMYTLRMSDGRLYSFLIGANVVDPGPPVTLTPTELFRGDTVLPCRSVTRGFRIKLNPCITRQVTSEQIIGTGGSDYTLVGQTPKPLTGNDSITITFSPGGTGTRPAFYECVLSDGSRIRVNLYGVGLDAGPPIVITPSRLFETDTLMLCEDTLRSLVVATGVCVGKGVRSQVITGAAANDYTIVRSAPSQLTGADTVDIQYAPKLPGYRAANYVITLDDGATRSIPLVGNSISPRDPLTATVQRLFEDDSIPLCTSVTRGFRLRTGDCIIGDVTHEEISGAASGDYTLQTNAPNRLTGDDSITITFTPTAAGDRNAVYTIRIGGSIEVTIPLEGAAYDSGYSLRATLTPSPLFGNDSVELCSSLERSFVISAEGCIIPESGAQTLNGVAANDYAITRSLPPQLTGSDTVTIAFSPSALGKHDAFYTLTMQGGKMITVPLSGIGINDANYTIDISPDTLFLNDTIFTCDFLDRTIMITKGDCAELHRRSERITGLAASDYSIESSTGDSISSQTSVIIRFAPSAYGRREALYTVEFDDGRTLSVVLAAAGRTPTKLAFTPLAQYVVDTVGGDVIVPIAITGMSRAEAVEFTITFDRNLEYRGTRSRDGIDLDLQGTTTATSSRIRIPTSEIVLNDTSAFAYFSLFVDTVAPSAISLADLSATSAQTTCQYVADSGVTTTVTGPAGCGITTISDFVRYQKRPVFRAYPNPATDRLTIAANMPVGLIRMEIVDAAGKVRTATASDLSLTTNAVIELKNTLLSSGSYFLRITGEGFSAVIPVVVER